MHLIASLGILRSLLLLTTALVCAAAPFADGQVHTGDWRLLTGVVAPTVMMMLVFALPLDMTMARVFMSDAEPPERARLAFAIKLEGVALLALVGSWTPFIYRVIDFTPLG